MMNECYRITPKCSLQQTALHEIAKICWGDYVLRSTIDSRIIFTSDKIQELNTYFDNILHKLPVILNDLPRTFSADFPKPLIEKVKDAVIRLRQGYKDALIWEKRCEHALPFTILNPTAAGYYQAKYFIDPTGYFNDWLWTKKFVFDENQDVLCRFLIACFYCFTDQIRNLWPIVKMNGEHPCKVPCKDPCKVLARTIWKYVGIVGLWVNQLENEIHDPVEENLHDFSFCVSGFLQAIDERQEHAARFFWSGCTETEKQELVKLVVQHKYKVTNAAKDNHTGIIYFIYSLLSAEQKKTVLYQSTSLFIEKPWIWLCLLDSLYHESILNEILTFPYVIPSKLYALLLRELACKSKESLNPIHLKIFKKMWNHLSNIQRFEVFKWDFHISFLRSIEAHDFLEFIIQTLSDREKKQVLSKDCGDAGWIAIDQFSKNDYYDTLLRYFLYFLIDRNPITQKLSLRADALNFLNDSIKESFTHWTKEQECNVPKLEVKEVSGVIDCLEGSLCVLNLLLQQVENTYIF